MAATKKHPKPLREIRRARLAWRSKPSWSIVATEERTVHPNLERSAAKRMGPPAAIAAYSASGITMDNMQVQE